MRQSLLEKRIPASQISQIKTLCRKHRVLRLFAFGSVLDADFHPDSDIDFLVSFDEVPLLEYGDNYFSLLESLRKLLSREIDLVIEKDLTNPVLIDSIRQHRALLYEKEDSEVVA
jgi:uncharacterized protein